MTTGEATAKRLIVDGRTEPAGPGPVRFGGPQGQGEAGHHAWEDASFTVTASADGWHLDVEDPGAGLYVNGSRVEAGQQLLHDGDHVEAGFHDLVLGGNGEPGPGSTALELTAKPIVIGRDAGCEVTLDDPAVDRRHARITRTGDGPILEDLKTRSGTRVNGERVRRRALRPGDRVGIAGYRIVYDGERFICPGAHTPLRVESRGAVVWAGGAIRLDRVSVSLEPGTLTAIIGESGAGKSTLMRALSGYQPPSEGSVTLNGEPVTETRPEIAVVPQSDLVFSGLTVEETLIDSAALRLPPDSEADELRQVARGVMDELRITEPGATVASKLSGGQRKRLSVGVELVNSPGVLFLDEPTTGLDPGLELTIMELLRELADAGRTVSLVTHATGSLSLCDSLIVIGRGGLLCFRGTPDEALEFFGVERYEEIYRALNDRAAEWAEAFSAISNEPARGPALPAPNPRRSPRLRDFARDFGVLFRRQWRLLRRDWKNLVIVAGQAPVLGVITGLLFKDDVFSAGAPPNKAVQLMFVVVMITLWLGAIGSCRELVKEKSLVARERAAGVSAVPYITSKLTFLMAVAYAQVAVFLAIVFAFQPLDQPIGNWLELLAVFAVLSFAAVTLGLAISAVSGTESQAISIVPLALIPQLLFAGSLIPPAQMSGVMEAISRLAASQWGLRGAGAAIDLQDKFDAFPPTPVNAGLSTGFFEITVAAAIAGLLVIAIVQLGVMAAGVRKRT